MDYQSSIFRQVMNQQIPPPQQQQPQQQHIPQQQSNGYMYTGYGNLANNNSVGSNVGGNNNSFSSFNPYPYGGARGGGSNSAINNNYFSSPPPLPPATPPYQQQQQQPQPHVQFSSISNNHYNSGSNLYSPLPPQSSRNSYYPMSPNPPVVLPNYYSSPPPLPPATPVSNMPSPKPHTFSSIVREINNNNNNSNNSVHGNYNGYSNNHHYGNTTPPSYYNPPAPPIQQQPSYGYQPNYQPNYISNIPPQPISQPQLPIQHVPVVTPPTTTTPTITSQTTSPTLQSNTTTTNVNNRYSMGFAGFNDSSNNNNLSTSNEANNIVKNNSKQGSNLISFKNNNNNNNNTTVPPVFPNGSIHNNPFIINNDNEKQRVAAVKVTTVEPKKKVEETSTGLPAYKFVELTKDNSNNSNSNNNNNNKTHKRFNSASSLNIESSNGKNNDNNNNNSSAPSSISNSNSNSSSNLSSSGGVAQSPLKSKLLKVVSDVKKGIPQVGDTLLTQYNNLSLSLSNGNINNGNNNNSNNSSSNKPQLKRSESLTNNSLNNNSSSFESPSPSPRPNSSSLSSSPIVQKNNKNSSSTTPPIKPPTKSIPVNNETAFFSYYGSSSENNSNHHNEISDSSESEQESDDPNRIVKSSRVLDNCMPSDTNQTTTHVDSILKSSSEAISIPQRKSPIQQKVNIPVVPTPAVTVTTTTTTTTNNVQFKSSMLSQLKTQQSQQQQDSSNVKYKPVNINSYPNIQSDVSSPSLSPSSLNNNSGSGNSVEYPSLLVSKAIKEDITLQRFKPLPPRPVQYGSSYGSNSGTTPPQSNEYINSNSPVHFHQLNNGSNNNNNNNNNGLKGLFSILTSSIPFNSDSEDLEISIPNGASIDRYKEDFSQYLNEFGDKSKIYQHIHWHLDQNMVNIETIKMLGCNFGFSDQCRATSWMLLLGYLPTNTSQRTSVLLHKRSQYRDLVKKHLPGNQDRQLTFIFKSTGIQTSSAVNGNGGSSSNNGASDSYSTSWDDNNNYYQQYQQLNQTFKNHSSKFISSMVNMVNAKAKNHEELVAQIHVDVIRTRPEGFQLLFELPEIEKMLERILMIWSIENNDISYFQGLNDLICPFLLVFLEHEINVLNNSNSTSYPSMISSNEDDQPQQSWTSKLEKLMGEGQIINELKECGHAEVVLSRVEADVFWCITQLMNSVKHYSTNTGCGLPAEGMMRRLEALVKESNDQLYKHLKNMDIDFSHFSFRWMVCFLTRDFNLETGIKLWDHYFCDKENQGFSLLHICFCSSLLSQWTPTLLQKDFMDLVQYLQKPPSLKWSHSDLELIFRKSYLLKDKYKNILH